MKAPNRAPAEMKWTMPNPFVHQGSASACDGASVGNSATQVAPAAAVSAARRSFQRSGLS